MTRRYRPFDPFERGGPFEAGREIRIPRPPRRFWFGVGLFGIAFLIFILASPIIWFFTELQWYTALGLSEASDKQSRLQQQACREHVAEPERGVPLKLGEEPDDGAGQDEDGERHPEKPEAKPESARRARDADLPTGLERPATLEGIEGPVAARHLPGSLRTMSGNRGFPLRASATRFGLTECIGRLASPTCLLTFPLRIGLLKGLPHAPCQRR